MILPVEYWGPGSYSKWIRVGWALKNTDPRLFITWLKFSSQSSHFDYHNFYYFGLDRSGTLCAWHGVVDSRATVCRISPCPRRLTRLQHAYSCVTECITANYYFVHAWTKWHVGFGVGVEFPRIWYPRPNAKLGQHVVVRQ